MRMDYPHDIRIGMAPSAKDNESCEHHTCIASAKTAYFWCFLAEKSKIDSGASQKYWSDGAVLLSRTYSPANLKAPGPNADFTILRTGTAFVLTLS